jgi:hypothetical protein
MRCEIYDGVLYLIPGSEEEMEGVKLWYEELCLNYDRRKELKVWVDDLTDDPYLE